VSRYRSTSASVGYPRWTPAVKWLIITCVAVWVLQHAERFAGLSGFSDIFALRPADVLRGYVWQLATYIFLHDAFSPLHILFNMLGLWMFGSELERHWGSRRFLRFFFVCGIGAGVLMVLLSPLTDHGMTDRTIGASGSVYGVLLAFGVLFPDVIIYWIIFPIKAKWLVLILGGIAFYSSIAATGSSIAHVAHLGGMLCGFIYLKGWGMTGGLMDAYQRWRRARLRRKFDVYYNQRQKDDDQRWRRWKN
jgi:membrane associated rhomboid family serine protease